MYLFIYLSQKIYLILNFLNFHLMSNDDVINMM